MKEAITVPVMQPVQIMMAVTSVTARMGFVVTEPTVMVSFFLYYIEQYKHCETILHLIGAFPVLLHRLSSFQI